MQKPAHNEPAGLDWAVDWIGPLQGTLAELGELKARHLTGLHAGEDEHVQASRVRHMTTLVYDLIAKADAIKEGLESDKG